MNSSGRLARAVALVAGALGFTGADLIRKLAVPSNDDVDAATLVSQVQAHSGLWLVAGFAMLLGSMIMLPGVAALAGSVTGRGRRLVQLGAILLAGGLVASVGHALAFYGFAAVGASSGVPAAAYRAMDDESNRYPLYLLVIVLFVAGTVLGSVLLAVGLRRAGIVPIWVPVAAIVFAVTGTIGGVASGIVGVLAALATFAPMGRLLVHGPHASAPTATAGVSAGAR